MNDDPREIGAIRVGDAGDRDPANPGPRERGGRVGSPPPTTEQPSRSASRLPAVTDTDRSSPDRSSPDRADPDHWQTGPAQPRSAGAAGWTVDGPYRPEPAASVFRPSTAAPAASPAVSDTWPSMRRVDPMSATGSEAAGSYPAGPAGWTDRGTPGSAAMNRRGTESANGNGRMLPIETRTFDPLLDQFPPNPGGAFGQAYPPPPPGETRAWRGDPLNPPPLNPPPSDPYAQSPPPGPPLNPPPSDPYAQSPPPAPRDERHDPWRSTPPVAAANSSALEETAAMRRADFDSAAPRPYGEMDGRYETYRPSTEYPAPPPPDRSRTGSKAAGGPYTGPARTPTEAGRIPSWLRDPEPAGSPGGPAGIGRHRDPNRGDQAHDGRAHDGRAHDESFRTEHDPSAAAGRRRAGGPVGPGSRETGNGRAGLATSALLPAPPETASRGWRRLVYQVSAGAVNPGPSPDEVRDRRLLARIRNPLHDCHRIAVMSLKGGVGKTTTTVAVGSTLASLRDDRVVAIDANPDRGTLGSRVPRTSAHTVRELLEDAPRLHRYVDVRRYLSQADSRLEVLASANDPELSDTFGDADYRAADDLLQRHYSILLTDCGTGILHSAMHGVLELADTLVIVSSASADGGSSASATLDWLDAHGYSDHVREAVAVISMFPVQGERVDVDTLERHFEARTRRVVRVPFDPHLADGGRIVLSNLKRETRAAYREIAGAVAERFGEERRGYPGG
ncbi:MULTISPECIES: MinD/ParA family protein [unclassified Frankia]|uniref:MinD/ParA family ATP-binding protein n=1 Tax=unclassified Frankia TaxID=2632575 RepID=UPI000461CF15|nr:MULTISPECIES: MinD/ParA family protein [unclassified Frankia]KDA44134.1 ATPase involved in chromosome partitioning [Frankia sp. BMG5.23]